jgi:hypothetical protein
MAETLEISPALARALNRRSVDLARETAAWETGERTTRPASQSASPAPCPALSVARRFTRKWQRSPDKRASMERRRALAGGGHMPPRIRALFTEGERAVMMVIAGAAKAAGACDMPIDKIAAVAGVCRTTAQNAMRRAVEAGVVAVQHRPMRGRKSLTNVVRVIAGDWLAWIKRGPDALKAIGFKLFRPTVNQTEKIKSGATVEAIVDAESAARGFGMGALAGYAPNLDRGAPT